MRMPLVDTIVCASQASEESGQKASFPVIECKMNHLMAATHLSLNSERRNCYYPFSVRVCVRRMTSHINVRVPVLCSKPLFTKILESLHMCLCGEGNSKNNDLSTFNLDWGQSRIK